MKPERIQWMIRSFLALLGQKKKSKDTGSIRRTDDTVQRSYEFPDYSQATAFVHQIGQSAGAREWRPEIDVRPLAAEGAPIRVTVSCQRGELVQGDLDAARRVAAASGPGDA